MAESPLEFALEQQRLFDAASTFEERRAQGHFGTPLAIARFMATLAGAMPTEGPLKVLDPGAGVGILSAAVCEYVGGEQEERRVSIELWESNPHLVPFIEKTMAVCRRFLLDRGHSLDFLIHNDDFIMAHGRRSLFAEGPCPRFHLAILNPPYYKLRKESPHARAMEHVVHGQPNIYCLFLALAAELLLPEGRLVAITPRSYFSGPYFKRFRKWFFDRMSARQIHLFDSRTDAFREGDVLQENVVLMAERDGARQTVVLSSSAGRDLADIRRCVLPYDRVVSNSAGDHVVRISTDVVEQDLIAILDGFPNRLCSFGCDVSTGPVVTFRATEFLRHERSPSTAPLLWMHNVRPFRTVFQDKAGKPSHIAVSETSRRLLLPARRYVLLKRFTAKEEKRRLVAGIVEAGDSYADRLGLENHLNYVWRRSSELSRLEALGLAAYFNSSFVDRYFRAVSGNTQVNAAELRSLPLPELEAIIRIGESVEDLDDYSPTRIDEIVSRAIQLPSGMIREFAVGAVV